METTAIALLLLLGFAVQSPLVFAQLFRESDNAVKDYENLGEYCSSKYSYSTVIHKSLLFYEAQRSGKLPLHNRIKWRSDSMLQDGMVDSVDLSNGYFTNGGFTKNGFPTAASITLLAWGALSYKEAYEKSGEISNLLDAIKWGTDYFLKCHVDDYVFYGQVGLTIKDAVYWGRPEDYQDSRPIFKITKEKPGSDLTAETAAALAASSILFREKNKQYSEELIRHSKVLYNFANKYRGKYHESIPDSANAYQSSGYGDELAWASLWLHKATEELSYLENAITHYKEFELDQFTSEFSWDDKSVGVQVLLAEATGELHYKERAVRFCDWYLTERRTPKGLVWIKMWGPLRYAANAAFICLRVADLRVQASKSYEEFAFSQINYILGDNGHSYMVGFGFNPPRRPCHRASSCPTKPAVCDWSNYLSAKANSHVLQGAVVGGPDSVDFYVDKRTEYIKNEVALDFNAGFQSAVAGLLQLNLKGNC